MADVAFVLLTAETAPESPQVLAAARTYGMGLVPRDSSPGTLIFELASGGNLIIALMPAPHPDAPQMPVGVTSPVYAEIATSPAHLVVAATVSSTAEVRIAIVVSRSRGVPASPVAATTRWAGEVAISA